MDKPIENKNYYAHVDEAMKDRTAPTALSGKALEKAIEESDQLRKKSGKSTAFGDKISFR